jgi:hypothetical protein
MTKSISLDTYYRTSKQVLIEIPGETEPKRVDAVVEQMKKSAIELLKVKTGLAHFKCIVSWKVYDKAFEEHVEI